MWRESSCLIYHIMMSCMYQFAYDSSSNIFWEHANGTMLKEVLLHFSVHMACTYDPLNVGYSSDGESAYLRILWSSQQAQLWLAKDGKLVYFTVLSSLADYYISSDSFWALTIPLLLRQFYRHFLFMTLMTPRE